MSLTRYRQKRDPERTPEPFGEERALRARSGGATRSFVVQQHAARRLHWDLRLEIGSALASWAVPKGPSLDRADKRLAVRTEDHPLEYAHFEGVIPAGSYGAGAMIVWDCGAYGTVEGRDPAEGLEAGKLDLVLAGHKLRGRFALVRTRGEQGNEWLLLCKRTAEDATLERDWERSVLSGLDVAEVGEGVRRDDAVVRLAKRAGAARGVPDLAALQPMLCETAQQPFSDPDWLFELKEDGARVLASKPRDGAVRLVARSGRDVTGVYPEVSRALVHLPVTDCILDGEVVARDERRLPSFERLQRRFGLSEAAAIERAELEVPVVFVAFDALAACGHDLRALPLRARKQILARFAPRRGFIEYADHVEGEGVALFEQVKRAGREGVIAKRADSPYQAGRRSPHWKKLKAPRRAALTIVGYVPERGVGGRLGALHLAWWRGGELVHAGRVGSGLDEAGAETLRARLEPLQLAEPLFVGAPSRPPRGTTWVRPELVAAVRYIEETRAGSLRQPVFEGVRDDLTPADCLAPDERVRAAARAETPAPDPSPALKLTNLDKVFWPEDGYTKGDLLGWYEGIWPWLEPYLRDRPVVLSRYPDGIHGKSFYQKHAPEFTPEWVRREVVDDTEYFVCNDLDTLLYVINLGAIPLHVWSARLGSIDRPDWLILDLDPKEAPFAHVVEVARRLHALLGELDAAHFVKTSGQDGLHVMLPLGGRLGHDEAKELGHVLARVVCAELPKIATIARRVASRGGKVYVDYLQNGRGKLIAAPFSVRPRPGAPVSMPLGWRQVTKRLDPARFTLRTARARLVRAGDPLAGVLGTPVDVPALLAALLARVGA